MEARAAQRQRANAVILSTACIALALSISDNASGNPQAVTPKRVGTPEVSFNRAGTPAVSLSATSLAFGSQPVGTPTTQTVTLSNTGNAALSITSFALTGANAGDFSQTNTCGKSLAAGVNSNCTISVTFTPSVIGPEAALLSITDNARGSPQTVRLSGTGSAAAPVVNLSPTSLAFGKQRVGTTSTAQTVTLSNMGKATVSITGFALTGTYAGNFAQTNNCGKSLAAGVNSNCTISVTFTPSATGTEAALLSITDNASGSPQTVSLSGTGTGAAARGPAAGGPAVAGQAVAGTPAVSLSPTSLAFGNQPVDMTSTAQIVTLSNTGNGALSITSLAPTGANAGDFGATDTCGTSVAAGANCTIAVMYTPSVTGSETASLSIADNASGSPQTVSLSGAGTHDVILTWVASSPATGVVGYNVYRGTTSGGPYTTELNSSPVGGTTYTDATVQAGQTYYYVVTAVASNDVTQSPDSLPASASVPSP
jgi:hypothetical protein